MSRERILEISYENKLSHLGSNLSSLDIIDAIYDVKLPNEKFVLSAGHCGLALYTVLEKKGLGNAEDMLHLQGIHPDARFGKELGIEVSAGSLGQGLPIALGMALADRNRKIYCMVSDGEMSEGSIWESLRIGEELKILNLKVICNFNGWAAYKETNEEKLIKQIAGFGWQVDCIDGHNKEEIKFSLGVVSPEPHFILARTNVEQYPFLKGQGAHYYSMSENDYLSTK